MCTTHSIRNRTVRPTTHIFDNKASAAYKAEIKKNCKYQLVPPDNLQRNLEEWAIQTFKNHFKAVITGVNDTFPMRFWDRLFPQTVLTLNLLHQSNVAPTVSAYQYIHGCIWLQQNARGTNGMCSPNPQKQWEKRHMSSKCSGQMVLTNISWTLVVPYCHVKSTRSERVSDTVHFKHKNITQPTITPEDTIVKALNDLTQALKERRNTKGTE